MKTGDEANINMAERKTFSNFMPSSEILKAFKDVLPETNKEFLANIL